MQAQVQEADRLVVQVGQSVGDRDGCVVVDLTDEAATELMAAMSQPNGGVVLAVDGTITVLPPVPPPIVYAGVQLIGEPPVRTTDDQPHEVLRFTTFPQHVYRTTIRVSAIDAGNGTTRDSEVRMVFKGLAASIVQVGATIVMSNMQDTAAASWRIQAAPQGTDLVITVTGAAGRTIDWQVTGDIGVFAPAGLEA